MKHKALIVTLSLISGSLSAASNEELQQQIQQLQEQTKLLQTQLKRLQNQVVAHPIAAKKNIKKQEKPKPVIARHVIIKHAVIMPKHAEHTKPSQVKKPIKTKIPAKNSIQEQGETFHTSTLRVHTVDSDPESVGFYPTALIAEGRVITYIAGTPVVTSPYLGARPAFDGSDYIVNISSINRDIRLMQQRRGLYRAYESIGYPAPNVPIIALSGKVEPVAKINRPYYKRTTSDVDLGSSEVDVAAVLNDKVEAFVAVAYDDAPPPIGPRVNNSSFNLNLGFVNIGNLDQSPFYFTGGQLYVPFGRYSSSMISAPLPQLLARTKSRPFILGYKSQEEAGPYLAGYGFKSETSFGHSGIGGVNLGYTIKSGELSGDVGVGYISSITDSAGMQETNSAPFTTFGGFASATNGTELIRKVAGVDLHGNISFDRYTFTAEWVGASQRFRTRDLSFNGKGAKPQAGQLEGGVTFMAFSKPASFALGYQWAKDTLALNIPRYRINGVFNISIWKDTIESLEYRHDIDYRTTQFANGATAPGLINLNTLGTGRSSDALIAQIGVFF